MTGIRGKRFLSTGMVATLACAACPTFGQNRDASSPGMGFPSRPMRMIVTSEAGSAPDVLARLIGQKLNESLGQAVVVENRAGAGGVIGYEIASRAQPDGYTTVMSTVAFVTTSTIHAKLPYDPLKSFTPIARVASSPYILVVSAQSPASSLKGLLDLARSQKGKLNYGSPGNGTAQHLTTELLKVKTGIDVVHVPYKSGAAAVNAVLGGEAQLFFAGMPPALPHVKSGRLRACSDHTAAISGGARRADDGRSGTARIRRRSMARDHRAGRGARFDRGKAQCARDSHARIPGGEARAACVRRRTESERPGRAARAASKRSRQMDRSGASRRASTLRKPRRTPWRESVM